MLIFDNSFEARGIAFGSVDGLHFSDDGSFLSFDGNEFTVFSKNFKKISCFKNPDGVDLKDPRGEFLLAKNGSIRTINKNGTPEKKIDSWDYDIKKYLLKKPGYFIGSKNSNQNKGLSIFGPNGKKYLGGIDNLSEIREFGHTVNRFVLRKKSVVPGLGSSMVLLDSDFKILLSSSGSIMVSPDDKLIVVFGTDGNTEFFDSNLKKINLQYQNLGFDKQPSFNFGRPDVYLKFPKEEDYDLGKIALRNHKENIFRILDTSMNPVCGPFGGRFEKFLGETALVTTPDGYNSLFSFGGKEILKGVHFDGITSFNYLGLGMFSLTDNGTKQTNKYCPDGFELKIPKLNGYISEVDFINGNLILKNSDGESQVCSVYDMFKEIHFDGKLVTVSECKGSPNSRPPKTFVITKPQSEILSVQDLEKFGKEVEIVDELNVKVGGQKFKKKLIRGL